MRESWLQEFSDPIRKDIGYLFEFVRFLEEMPCSLDDVQLFLTGKPIICLAIQLEDLRVGSADDKQRRRRDLS